MGQTAPIDGGVDRRRFFRIADTVSLRYRSFTLAEEKLWLEGELNLDTESGEQQSVDSDIALEIERLKQVSPEFSAIADLLNQKLDRLSHQLSQRMDESFPQQYKTLNVSLSACGVGFPVKVPASIDDVLLVDMLLTTDNKRVLVAGRVVGCDTLSIPGPQDTKYMVRVNFERMDEQLSEELIHYVLQQQRRILAAQRLAEEEKELVALRSRDKS